MIYVVAHGTVRALTLREYCALPAGAPFVFVTRAAADRFARIQREEQTWHYLIT